MNFILSAIQWDVSPDIVSLGPLTLRWYGLLFASGFIFGQSVMSRIYRWENKPAEDLDKLMLYMVVSTILGARLGHCFFYEPDFYLSNPIEIFKVWKGGLASHGATVGILFGLYLYSRHVREQSYLWILDRIVIVVALGGAFIRLGNLMNSEIVGLPTELPWGFVFVRNDETFARHPAQLYESLSCVLLFIGLFLYYKTMKEKTPAGRLFSIFVIVLFSLRIFYEFFKEVQVDFEKGMALNMGQWLSIPMVFVGFIAFFLSFRKQAPLEQKG